ncbi:MAG: class I SAM-dependent methyltransferase [Bacteroidota bacterium]
MKRILRAILTRIKSLFLSSTAKRHGLVGQPELWKIKRDFQIDYLKSVGLKPEHYLVDIGCGTLRGGIPLIEYLQEGHYYGIEFRDFVLEEGRKELKENNLENKVPVLLVSKDLATLSMDAQFDYMWAFSVMIHMKDEIADKCLMMVSKHLKPNGVYYANVNIGEWAEGNWEGFPVVCRNLEFYKTMAAKYHLKVEDVGDLKSCGHITGIDKQDSQRMLKFSK